MNAQKMGRLALVTATSGVMAQPASDSVESVVVSGSRLVTNGAQAPRR